MPSRKSADSATSERAREVFRRFMDREFGSQVKAAEALGISQGAISSFLRGASGIGPKMMDAVRGYDPAIAQELMAGDEQDAPGISSSALRLADQLEDEGVGRELARWAAQAAHELSEVRGADAAATAKLLVALGNALPDTSPSGVLPVARQVPAKRR